MLKLSIIVPVYNRPEELNELLESLAEQTFKDFEIIIVEDGSTEKSDNIVEKFNGKLNIKYFYKANEKPAIARNFGMKKATGNYFLFFDSDCIVPPQYMEKVTKAIAIDYVDAFGGPDRAHESFSKVQKAINYAMTSFVTTGGIRGGEKIDKFYPRSFNMGLSQKVFEETGGFPVTKMHPGEDMVLSIEIIKRGFKTRLIKEAYVYHKRRTSLKIFFRQVYKFGKVRYIMSEFYPETFKLFYLFPGLFTVGTTGLLLLSVFNLFFLIPVGLFAVIVFIDSLLKNKNLEVALL
jgi:glycosyltransferase involved in cell wall biosynthesis